MPLHVATFLEAGVTGAKYGLSLLGKVREEVRLPLVPSTQATKDRIRAAMITPACCRLKDRPWPRNLSRISKSSPTTGVRAIDFEIGETFEAGIALTGTEVKSLRTGKATIAESYAHVDRQGEAWLVNANIPEYLAGNRFNHEPKRLRKLLLKSRELAKLSQAVEREGMTIVPLRLYFNARGARSWKSLSGAARSFTTSARSRRSATGAAKKAACCAKRARSRPRKKPGAWPGFSIVGASRWCEGLDYSSSSS